MTEGSILDVVMVGDKYLAARFRLAGARTVITDNDDETERKLTELVENQEVKIARAIQFSSIC